MAAKALATVLSAKARDGELLILDELKFEKPKTKEAARVFAGFSKDKPFADITAKKNRILLALDSKNKNVERAARNLPFIEINESRNITALDVLNRKYLIMPQAAIAVLAKRITGNR